MNFKGTTGKWTFHQNEYGHITSIRSIEANRIIFTSKVNNIFESNSNMILASKSKEMFELLKEIYNGIIKEKHFGEKYKDLNIDIKIKELIEEITNN